MQTKTREQHRKDMELLQQLNSYINAKQYGHIRHVIERCYDGQRAIKFLRYFATVETDTLYFKEYKRQDTLQALLKAWYSITTWTDENVKPNSITLIIFGIGGGAVGKIQVITFDEQTACTIDRYLTVGRNTKRFNATSTPLSHYIEPTAETIQRVLIESTTARLVTNLTSIVWYSNGANLYRKMIDDIADIPLPTINNISHLVLPNPYSMTALDFENMNYTDTIQHNKRHGKLYLTDDFRSGSELYISEVLKTNNISAEYETKCLPFNMSCKYTPDFVLPNGVYIEVKGFLSSDRQRYYEQLKKNYPALDLRFVFERDMNLSISSTSTLKDWATRNGFRAYFLNEHKRDKDLLLFLTADNGKVEK